MAEVSRVINGKTWVFPDEETARQAEAALEASRIARAQKEESFFDAGAFLKSIIPGIIKGTGTAAQGIGSLIQSEGTKEFGRGLGDFSDVVSEKYMGLEPYRRYTTGAQYGQTLGGMAPALAGTAAAVAALPETAGASAALIPALVGGLIGGAQGAGEVSEDIDQARKRGVNVTPEQEQKQALAQGLVTGGLESLSGYGLTKLAKLGRLGKGAIASGAGQEVDEVAKLLTMADRPIIGAGYGARALKQAGLEGGTEALQQASLNTLARGDLSGVFGPGYDPQRDLMEGVQESFTAGAVFGGVLGGGVDLYNRHKINQAKSKIRQVQDQSAEVGLQREDAVIGREIDGQIRQGEVAGTLTEEINKRLNDTLTAASVTINNEEASPLDKLNAYREFAAQYNSGKTFGELRGKDIISANKLAQSYFEGESSPESLEIGIQARESAAPGSVDMVDVKPVEGKVGRSQIYNGINFDEMVDGKPFDGKELPVVESTPADTAKTGSNRILEFQNRKANITFSKPYGDLTQDQADIIDAQVDKDLDTTILPTRIESRQQQQAAVEEDLRNKQAAKDKAQEQRDLKAQDALSLAADRDYIIGNDPLFKSVSSELGLKGRLKNSDISAVAQLMRDRVSETTQAEKDAQLKASADQANIKLQDNLAVAEPLSRELFGKNIPLLYDSQKIVLAKRLDINLGQIAAEKSRLQQEASLRTDINLTTPDGDPIDVRLDRAAVKIYGKRFGELSELRQGAVRNAEERIGSVVLPAEVKEKEQLKNYGVDAGTLRSVIGELRNPEINPVDEQSGLVKVDASTIQSIPLVRGMRGKAVDNAQALFGAMIERGDVIESGGNYYLDPDTDGPMYKLPPAATTTQPAVAAATPTTPVAPAAPVEPERGTPRPRSIPLKLDVETARRVSSEAYQQLRKLGVSDIYSTVVIDNFLDSKGNIRSDSAQFLNDVIKLASKQNNIAESEENLVNTVNHEVVHGMKKSGFFSDSQWKLMTNQFTVAGELDEPTIKAYRERFKNETPARIDEILQEEAVAYAMERLYNQPAKPLSFPEKTLMQRVKALAGIGTAANNLNYTAEDLISAIRAGDIGRMAIPGKPNMLSPARTTTQAAPVVTQSPSEEQDTEALTDKEKAAAEGDVPTELQGQSKPDFSFVGGAAYSSDPVEGKRIADFRKAARKMEEDGRSNEEIRLATGWFRNPYDNILRYEVSDENAKLTQAFSDLEESKFLEEQKNITLDQALDHPELFKAYPELKDIKVIKQAGLFDRGQRLQGSFNPATNTVNITPYNKNPESTLIHEIQHWIQEKEGFASGGNEQSVIKAASPKVIEKALAKVVQRKTADLESMAKEVNDLRSSLDVASRYPNDIQQLSDLSDKEDKRWEIYREDKSDSNKEQWFTAKDKWSTRFGEFRDKIKSDMGVGRDTAWDMAWGAKSATQENVSEAEKRFVDAQKEIANIRSGDEKAIAAALKSEAFGMYSNIAGEIESRDVEARRKYPESQRSSEKPYTSENISPDDSIVTYGSKGKGIESMFKLTGDEEADSQAMFKMVEQKDPKLFKAKKEDSILDLFKAQPISQIPSTLKAVGDAIIEKPSVRKLIGPSSVLGKALSLRTDWIQSDAPIAKQGENLFQETGNKGYTDTATSAIAAKRQAEKFNEVLSSALNIGYVYFDKARGFFMVKEDSNYAIMPQFKKLSQSGKLYQAWDAAIAQRFVDAENSGVDAKDTLGGNFTLKQAQDTVNAYKGDADIQEFLKVYRNFNNSLIELNRYVGNFDVATEARLKAWYYSSYYRVPVDENGQLEAPSKSRGLKAISGRELQINDMIENFITNAQYMVGYAMKNEADRRSIRDSVDNKLANRLEGPDEKGNIVSSPKFATNKKMVVRVNENGKKAYYEILDPILYKSLSDTRVRLASLAVLGKGFSNYLRTGVTSAPSFMFNNMFLDAFRLWGLGIYEDNVLKSIFGNIYDGFKSVSSEDDTYKTLMKAGLIGSMKLSRDSVQAATDIRRELAIAQGNAFVNLLRTMKNSTLGTLENISAKSEAVNRVQVYKNVNKNMLKKGLSVEAAESAALYAAMNYPVNFDVRGAGEVAQYAAALLPFVNASAQGTDVFYQSLRSMAQTRGVMLKGQKQRVPVNQLQASALAASKSALYNSIIAGTLYTFALAALAPDEWKKATPEERNRTLFIPIGSTAIKIPIPPELGLIALSIPNAFAEAIIGQDNGPQMMKSLTSYFINLFTFSPVPQIVRPAAEVAVNKNFFTWRPIENMTEERILPEYRYDENTTLIGRGLGSAAAKLKMPISPMQFDHLIRGYLGTTGMFASDLISQVFGAAIGKNDPDRFRPISDPYLLPVVGKLFTAPNDRKAIQDYYEIRNHATRAANTLKSIDLAKEYKDNPEKLRAMAYWSQINTALEAGPDQRMQELRKLKAKVQVATVDVLTPSQKTDMIKQINMKMSEVARGVQQLKRELPFTWF